MGRPVTRATAAPAVVAAAAALALVVTGCGADEPAGPFPERPQDIAVDRIDPCATLTAARQAELQVDAGELTESQVNGARSRDCGWSNFDNGTNYTVQFIDLDARSAVGTGPVEVVAGYGVVRLEDFPESAPLCSLVVDAGAGRLIRVQVQATHDRDGRPRPMSDVCREAAAVTTGVIETARSLGR